MSVQQDMLGILMAFGLRRVAELLRDPTVGNQDERRKWAELFDNLGKEGVAQESLKLATKPDDQ